MNETKNSDAPWPLSARVAGEFEDSITDRGEEYFQSGHALLSAQSGTVADVKVAGSKLYTVQCDWSAVEAQSQILIRCDCPHYGSGVFCKHCWAAVLVIDDAGISKKIAGPQLLSLVHAGLSNVPYAMRVKSLNRNLKNKSQSSKSAGLTQLKSIKSAVVESKNSFRQNESGVKNSRIGFYALDLREAKNHSQIAVEFYQQEMLRNGSLGTIKQGRVSKEDVPLYSDPVDREIMAILLGHSSPGSENQYYAARGFVPPGLQNYLIQKMVQTGRFFRATLFGDAREPIVWDEGDPWRLKLVVKKVSKQFNVSGLLTRGAEEISVDRPDAVFSSGLLIRGNRFEGLEVKDHFSLFARLRGRGFAPIPESESGALVELLHSIPDIPEIDWPEELRWTQERPLGIPGIVFGAPQTMTPGLGVIGNLRFVYDNVAVPAHSQAAILSDSKNRRIIFRSFEDEKKALNQLLGLEGLSPISLGTRGEFSIVVQSMHFSKAVSQILSWGWSVVADGRSVRSPRDYNIQVSSGVDWFDLSGSVQFSETLGLKLPDLVAALERGEKLVPLGDGTLGMLPSEWLKKYAPLARVGEAHGEGFRFKRSQGILLSAWLAEVESLRVDRDFSKLKHDLSALNKLKPKSPTRSFKGELRSYQKVGLSWLGALRNLGVGGILADDMGLGKTVQVLAHLEAEYARVKDGVKRPSLVIVPKSLLFNWQEEAQRFTPSLKVFVYAGAGRHDLLNDVRNSDLVLVTYSTLRQDFEKLRSQKFHYLIADEAQAIKNSDSLTYKAVRLMEASHRLAMTGTPVENSVDDLFSILDFVNPGLLGPSARNRISKAATHGNLESGTLSEIAKALKPFVLRRTKDQVTKDLPEKTEKVIYCELSPTERKNYNDLRDHYRAHLYSEIEERGLAKTKIIVLEALLRLRQAACHPGLIDKKQVSVESSKLATLVAQIEELMTEGHKALVFSQFTSFLDIVETALRKRNITFERLDGKTSQEARRDRVTKFQQDFSVKIFLVSLKAGGVGLNLTAADYVFILDPWWNPAVESQAIDRSHRIGQKNKVIAYRLIAKGTVEEKIIQLQKSKRYLADALISTDASLLKKLTAQDLEVLLS